MTETDQLVERLKKHATFAGRASDIALSIGLAGTSDWDQVAGGVDIFGVQEDCARAAARLEAQSRALTASQEAIDTLREENERLRKALEEAEEVFSLSEIQAFPDPAWHDQVKALGQRIGFGALMSTAEAGWRETLEAEGYSGAEHTSGPCRSTINRTLALIRAALNAKHPAE